MLIKKIVFCATALVCACIQNNVMTLIPPLEQLCAVVRQSCTRRAAPLREHQGDASGGGECWCQSEGGGKGSASLLATQSIFIQPRGRGGALLLWTLQKPSPHRPNQSSRVPNGPLPALSQQVPESSLGGWAGSMLSCLPWGHLPLMVILIYAQAFNRILIGCVAALSDSVAARTWFWWVFVFAFLFFCIFLHAHFCSLMVKIISLAYLHISPVRKKSEASHGRPLITNYKVMKTWKCSIGGQQESKCGRLEHSSVSSLHKFKRGASLYFCNSVCSLALC